MEQSKLSLPRELFPYFDKPGNLVHYTRASKKKLQDIFMGGLRPRYGKPQIQSYYPDVVSFSALYDKSFSRGDLTTNRMIAKNNATRYHGNHSDASNFYNLVIVLNTQWVAAHIDEFRGVGSSLNHEITQHRFLQNSLSKLQCKPDFGLALRNEVQYIADTVPPESFAGILIDETDTNDSIDNKFLKADQMVKEVITGLKQNQIPLSPLALYSQQGELYDILA